MSRLSSKFSVSKSMQQLEDISQIKKTRKKIARIKTLLTEAKASLNS